MLTGTRYLGETEETTNRVIELGDKEQMLGGSGIYVVGNVMSKNHIESEKCDGKANVIHFTESSYNAKLKASQRNDPNLKVIVEAVEIGVKPSRESISKLPSSVKVLLGHWDHLEV